jgi:hypothetical protein
MKSKAHKPALYHPWGYTTWRAIERGKDNYWDYLRIQAKLNKLSPKGQLHLEWVIFYYTFGERNVSKTTKHFGIARKTLRVWLKRFDGKFIKSLEEKPKRPKQVRTWMVSQKEEEQIIALRKENMEFGKRKLKILYLAKYQENISTWKIERVVRKHKLFQEKKNGYVKVKHREPRIRIHKVKELLQEFPAGVVWHTDSIIIWWYGTRKVIFTALENKTKLGFARVYKTNSSANAADFLKRLSYLSNNQLAVIHSDNGSEFDKDFASACKILSIQQVFSRPHTPKDNPCLEKFNHTVQREWLSFSVIGLDDINEANIDLTEWLVKYNSIRPHQALDYKTPLDYAYEQSPQLVPMTPARTMYLKL